MKTKSIPIVVHSGGPGPEPGSTHEYASEVDRKTYKIEIGLPIGARIIDAWYTLLDNVSDIVAFNHLDVRRHDNRSVDLLVSSKPQPKAKSEVPIAGRVKLRIFVLYD